MDFFQFASYAEIFVPFTMGADGQVDNRLWICLLVGGLCFLIVYIFQAVGLFTIARREGYRHKWMAFVPFFNLYYIGVCAQKNNVYGMNAKKFAIIPAVLEVVLVVGYILYYVAAFTIWDYIKWDLGPYDLWYASGVDGLPASMQWLSWIFFNLNDYILSWFELIFIVLKLFLLTAFFRTYSARQYMLFSIVGALLPLTGILIFAVRNNAGMSYSDYIRKVGEQNYRMYQQQYGNPYNQNYNQNPYQGGGSDNSGSYGGPSGAPAEDPFDEYGSSSGSSAGSSGGQSDSSSNSGSGSGSGGSSGSGSPFDDF